MDHNNYLRIAYSDLKASDVLYRNCNFSQSLFYFYQAIEKSTKFLGLELGIIKEEDLKKKIKHDTIKIFVSMLNEIKKNQLVKITVNIDDLTSLSNSIKNISDKEIAVFILKKIVNVWQSEPVISINKLSSPFKILLDYYKEIGINDPALDKPMSEIEFKYLEQAMKESSIDQIMYINYGSKIIMLMFVLNLYTNCYKVDDLRYPNEKMNNPTEYFSGDNEYVKILETISPILYDIFDLIKKIKWSIRKK